MESYLTQEGYRVLTVANREKPDLIVLDVMMPETGGYEFMRSSWRLTRQANDTQPRPMETEVKETTQITED